MSILTLSVPLFFLGLLVVLVLASLLSGMIAQRLFAGSRLMKVFARMPRQTDAEIEEEVLAMDRFQRDADVHAKRRHTIMERLAREGRIMEPKQVHLTGGSLPLTRCVGESVGHATFRKTQ